MKISRSVSVDENLAKKADEILGDIGLSFSGAINLFLMKLVAEDGLPFELKRKPKVESDE